MEYWSNGLSGTSSLAVLEFAGAEESTRYGSVAPSILWSPSPYSQLFGTP